MFGVSLWGKWRNDIRIHISSPPFAHTYTLITWRLSARFQLWPQILIKDALTTNSNSH